MVPAYFSLGSNVGDRAEHLSEGVRLVAQGEAYRVSSVYETKPVGGVEQDDFWNLVLEVTTAATPRELLERCRVAESARQRTRTVHFGPRTLDVDILFVGDVVSDDPELTIPHPRLYERRFVLAPLRELAPDLVSEDQLARSAGLVVEIGTLETLR